MTILLYSIFLIITLIFLLTNLLPAAGTKYNWFCKLMLAALTAFAYIFLISQILQPVIGEVIQITFSRFAPVINPLSGHFLIDNTSLILLAFFMTIMLFKSLQIPTLPKAAQAQISNDPCMPHHSNVLLGLLISGIFLIISDNLVHLLFAQILLSGVIIFQQIIVESGTPEKDRAGDYIWAILADILLLLAILWMYQHLKTLSISSIAETWNRNPSFIPIQTVAGILILTAFILKLALIPSRYMPLRHPVSATASILKDNSIEIALILFISFYKFRILLNDTCLFIMVILGFGIAIIAALISIVVDNPNNIRKYLLSAQIGLFLLLLGNGLHISGLIFLITFGFANLLLLYHSGIPAHPVKTIMKKRFTFGAISNWIALFSAGAICGFPLTVGFLPRSTLLTITFHQIQTTPAAWIYIVLIFIVFTLLPFSVFRYLFLASVESSDFPAISELRNPGLKAIIICLVLLNLAIVYSLPKVNPLLDAGWIAGLIATAELAHTTQAPNIYIILLCITLPILVGFLLALLTYYFDLIKGQTIQKIFNPVKRAVWSLDALNARFVRFIDTCPIKVANFGAYLENNITQQINRRIRQTTNYGAKFYHWISRDYGWRPITQFSDSKLLFLIRASFARREKVIPLAIIIIIIIAVVISII